MLRRRLRASTTTRGVLLVGLGDGEHPHLHRCEPRGERTGVVLEQHAEEPLDRTEQGTVQHDRTVPGVVGTDVLEVEALRELEVGLDRRQLPRPSDRVMDVDVDLRAVERGVAVLDGVVETVGVERLAQRLGRLLPDLVGRRRTSSGPSSTG